MNKTKWNEEQLEELLREMPKITDKRNPEYLYQHISKKRNIRKEKRVWLLPGLASLVGMLLFVLFSLNFVNFEDKSENNLSLQSNAIDHQDKVSFKMEQGQGTSPERAEHTSETEQTNKIDLSEQTKSTGQFDLMMATETPKTAVYQENLKGRDVITYGMPVKNEDYNGPISGIIKKQKSKNLFDQYEIFRKLLK